jgi:hypothetical protein
MPPNPEIERELAVIRADPRYGIDGADGDLLQREIDLLIRQVYEAIADDAQRRRNAKRRTSAPSVPARSTPAVPASTNPLGVADRTLIRP